MSTLIPGFSFDLISYGAGLTAKAEIVALSRADLVDSKQLAKAKKALEKAGASELLTISAATGDGVEGLLDAIIERLGPETEPAEADDAHERDWSPL